MDGSSIPRPVNSGLRSTSKGTYRTIHRCIFRLPSKRLILWHLSSLCVSRKAHACNLQDEAISINIIVCDLGVGRIVNLTSTPLAPPDFSLAPPYYNSWRPNQHFFPSVYFFDSFRMIRSLLFLKRMSSRSRTFFSLRFETTHIYIVNKISSTVDRLYLVMDQYV